MPLWQEAQSFADMVSDVAVGLPRRVDAEVIGRQVMRAAGSVPANIAEGYGRYSQPAYRNYLGIARASLFEVVSWIDLLSRRKLIAQAELEALTAQADKVGRMLTVRMRSLESSTLAVREEGLSFEA
jgi:four helix bundle protein